MHQNNLVTRHQNIHLRIFQNLVIRRQNITSSSQLKYISIFIYLFIHDMFFDIDWDFCLDFFYWLYKNLCYFVLIVVDQFKLKFCYNKKREKFRSIVRCEHCNFVVYVENWNQKCASYHENSWRIHVQKSSRCFLIIRFLTNLKKRKQTRIAKKQKEIRLTIFACRRCFVKFSSNTKFHQHVQNHHQKSTKFANEIAKFTSNEFAAITSKSMIAMSTFFSTFKAEFATFTSNESTLMLTLSTNQSNSIFDNSFSMISFATSIATSRKQIFWIEIISRSVIASKFSRFSIFTSKIISKSLKIASVICSSISSSIFSQKSISKHQHQKFYLTIDDLFEIFAKKRTKSNLSHIKKIEFSSKISRQLKIIFYFKSAANQSISISQDSKTSNSRSLNQFMSAKMSRVKFTHFIENVSEKSIVLSYKTSTFFYRLFSSSVSKISSILSYKMLVISDRLSDSSIFNVIFTSCHSCRICNDIFESNNDLHRHLRAIHFDHASRHEFEKHQTFERNIMSWKFLICWSKNKSFSYFFSCITNRFLEKRLACFRHATQRERCDLFSLMTSVTINLHIELKSKYLDKNELASWQSNRYFAFCFLDNNNSIILFITLLFNTFYRNNHLF